MLERVVVKRLRVLADTLLYRLYLTVFGEQQRFVFRVFLTVEIDIAVFTRGNGEHIVEIENSIAADFDKIYRLLNIYQMPDILVSTLCTFTSLNTHSVYLKLGLLVPIP